MIEKIYLILILAFFILAFAVKIIKTYFSTKQSIKGKSIKLTISVLLSTIIYVIIVLRLTLLQPSWIIELDLSKFMFFKIVGISFVTIGFVLGVLALMTMKNSWRVGIRYDQKTNLITNGIYKISRNPYFLSYNILIFGYILIFPSILLFILLSILAITFHKMIVEEEKYLETVHRESYLQYKEKVNRYFSVNL